MNKTLDYYNEKADDYFATTVGIDMNPQYSLFEKYLPNGAKILDCGCGSGRDSRHFSESGFDVTAIDGSPEMCRLASDYSGLKIDTKLFQEIDYQNEFDGVWACASLLHLTVDELRGVLKRIYMSLTEKGILYISFKYGENSNEKDGRFFTDFTEDTLKKLIDETGEFTIREQYVSEDLRPEKEKQQWLNAILVKQDHTELKPRDELEKVEKLKGELTSDDLGDRTLRIFDGLKDIDLQGVLAMAVQYADFGSVVGNIERTAEYIVKIPAKYQKQLEAGEIYLNRNQTTGIEWPTLMKKVENGRPQFVDNLPIKQQELIKGNPIHDFCQGYQNLYMQKQLAEISAELKTMNAVIKLIAQGQQDDRVALIDTGREEIMTALLVKDEESRKKHIENGRHDLMLGKNQLGKALERRISSFEAIPENIFARVGKAVFTFGDYLNQKDDEYEEIEECYELYHKATNMLAMSWGLTGELDALQKVYDDSNAFIGNLNTTNIKSIEHIHKGADFSDLFYNAAPKELLREKQICLDAVENYDYISIEVSGSKLLEVIKSGEVE